MAEASGDPGAYEDQLNAAAWRVLFEANATMGALAKPEQAHSALATLRSSQREHLLLEPKLILFTINNYSANSHSLFMYDCLADSVTAVIHRAFDFKEKMSV